MATITSWTGLVEKTDGKLVLRIPLASGGDELVACTQEAGKVEGDFLNIVIVDRLAEELGIFEGSTVDVDNADGKFHIRLSDGDPAIRNNPQVQNRFRTARKDALGSLSGGVLLLALAVWTVFRLPMYSVGRNDDLFGGGLSASAGLMVVVLVLFGVGLLSRAHSKWEISRGASTAMTRKRRKQPPHKRS